MSIGERITELRTQNGLSQLQLAKLLDVSRQAVSKWENDQSAPDTVKLIHLADVLDTDVEFLATGRHSQSKEPPRVVTVTEKVDHVVEKIVEKAVVVNKVVEVEKIVETVVDRPVIKKVTRVKYLRNPVEFAFAILVGVILGVVIGLIL